jgi:hypothetical protein
MKRAAPVRGDFDARKFAPAPRARNGGAPPPPRAHAGGGPGTAFEYARMSSSKRCKPSAASAAAAGAAASARISAVHAAQRSASGFDVVGNREMWNALLGAVHARTPPVCALCGPSGTGKTFGIAQVARAQRRRLVSVDCAEVVDSERSVREFAADLTIAATRAAFGDDDDAADAPARKSRRRPLIALESVEQLPSSVVPSVRAFLRTASQRGCVVVFVCAHEAPRWLTTSAAADARDAPAIEVRTFRTQRLTPENLRELLRRAASDDEAVRAPMIGTDPPVRISPDDALACISECAGDGRRCLALARLRMMEATTTTATADAASVWLRGACTEHEAARTLLYADLHRGDDGATNHAAVGEVVDAIVGSMRVPLVASIVHSNWLQAVSRSIPNRVGGVFSMSNREHAARLCARAELLSAADVLRTRDARQPTAGATYLSLAVATGAGYKGGEAPALDANHAFAAARGTRASDATGWRFRARAADAPIVLAS